MTVRDLLNVARGKKKKSENISMCKKFSIQITYFHFDVTLQQNHINTLILIYFIQGIKCYFILITFSFAQLEHWGNLQ